MNSVCFTGHRELLVTDQLKKQVFVTLEKLIQQGAIHFYAGGAIGWDTLCGAAVLSLRQKHPQIKLHLVLPCPPQEQTYHWTERDKQAYEVLLQSADSVECVSQSAGKGCMQLRNARLVELGDCCVCYYDPRNSASGTGQTVRMAQKKGIKILNLAE
jgi:uncharacterized phage-like protein YoqJ